MNDVTASGILTTASDLLFTGGREGYFQASDARLGKLPWTTNAGGDIAIGPKPRPNPGKGMMKLWGAGDKPRCEECEKLDRPLRPPLEQLANGVKLENGNTEPAEPTSPRLRSLAREE